jgi:hypothetical protein
MKFGKRLSEVKQERPGVYYIDYTELKKQIK